MWKVGSYFNSSSIKLRLYLKNYTIIFITFYSLRAILQKLDILGIIVKWVVELGEFNIRYKSRTKIKSQVLVDFVAKFSTNSFAQLEVHDTMTNDLASKLYIDNSSSAKGSRVRMIIEFVKHNVIEESLQFKFRANNNGAEYESLIVGLDLAKKFGTNGIAVYSNSQLVVN